MYRPSAHALHQAFYEYIGRLMFNPPHSAVRDCILKIEDRAKAIDKEYAENGKAVEGSND